MFNVIIFRLNFCWCFLCANYLKVIFWLCMRLCSLSKWNDNELMFKWNKEKRLLFSLKVDFKSLIVRYLVMLLSELRALLKFSVLEIASIAIWANLTYFPMAVYLNSLSFKTEYGRNVFVQSIQYQRVLTYKINVSLFIDLTAFYMNP